MELENQVCSLDQSKRLMELGVVQESFHQWIIGTPSVTTMDNECWMISRTACFGVAPEDWGLTYSAYTTTELGIMLPSEIRSKDHNVIEVSDERHLPLNEQALKYPYHITQKGVYKSIGRYRTEAHARAALLIHILENYLTSIEEVNERLKAA